MVASNEREYKPLLLLLYPAGKQTFKELWTDFKYSYKMEDVRKYLALCLESCLCTEDGNFSQPVDRSNMAHFISQLMALMEAKYLKDINQDEQYKKFLQPDKPSSA